MTLKELQLLKKMIEGTFLTWEEVAEVKFVVEREIKLKTNDPRKEREENGAR